MISTEEKVEVQLPEGVEWIDDAFCVVEIPASCGRVFSKKLERISYSV